MSNLIPIVSPPVNGLGTSVGISPTAIFEKAMEVGAITSSSCFLVETTRKDNQTWDEILNSADFLFNIVNSDVTAERINLSDDDVHTGTDYGNDLDSGEQYRTKITINPENLLKPNTNYAVLLSKDLTTVTVFDPEPNGGNSGDGAITLKGAYTGLVEDTYTVTIMESGTANSAKYIWSRASDGQISNTIESRARFASMDQGIKIKFLDGNFTIGDTYTIKVIPADYLKDIYSWNFSTGSGEFQEPEDDRSDSAINLPVNSCASTSGENLYVVSVSPSDAATQIPVARKSSVTVGSVVYITKEYTSSYNDYTIEYLSGGTAGSETVNLVDKEIQITIEDGVSTAQQVVDAFNADALGADIEASTNSSSDLQTIQEAKTLSDGIDANSITITFNKDLDPTSITEESIKVLTREIYPAGQPTPVSFTYNVSGNQLIITLQED